MGEKRAIAAILEYNRDRQDNILAQTENCENTWENKSKFGQSVGNKWEAVATLITSRQL